MSTTATRPPTHTAVRPRRRRRLTGRPRRLVRATHVVVAGGWLGLVVTMLVLGIAALPTDATTPPATLYTVMELIGGTVIPPLAVATLLTGLALSLLTPWGLVRHWWVVVKTMLGLTVIVTAISLTETWLQQAVTATTSGTAGVRLVATSAAHLAMLTFATIISVDKPWGRTPRGRRRPTTGTSERRPHTKRPADGPTGRGSWR